MSGFGEGVIEQFLVGRGALNSTLIRATGITLIGTALAGILALLKTANSCSWTLACLKSGVSEYYGVMTFVFLIIILPMMLYSFLVLKFRPHLQSIRLHLAIVLPGSVGYSAMKLSSFARTGQIDLMPFGAFEWGLVAMVFFGAAMLVRHILYFDRVV